MTALTKKLIAYFENLLVRTDNEDFKKSIQAELDRLNGKIILSDPVEVIQ